MFSTMSAIKFVFAQCIMTSNVLTFTDENHKKSVFAILPVNVPQSYLHTKKFKILFDIKNK